ncbi:hypothetical protein B0J18DRAFT_295324 [Chaetomium sp. MPI-SDFR-AT-0129]|nr:hypothetical protein B0J18DRAFT_295324 [Chaetomium sp. MPI-SDFR-AT-0129]
MVRNTQPRVRLAGLLAGATLLVGAAAQSVCYDTWGQQDPDQQPCAAPGANTGAATWCCNKGDTCLSNGLCMSPGSNNLMTQQGCTDRNWGGSCNKICPAPKDRELTAIPLIPCPASFDSATNTVKFCCGPDPSKCCSTPSSWIPLSTGTILASQGSSDSSNSNESSNSYSLKIGLGIGLGIGVPILLVLLAVAYLLSQPLHARRARRKRQEQQQQRKRRYGGTNTEKTSDTSQTFPPPAFFQQHHQRTSPSSGHKSFGQVDTRIHTSTDASNLDDSPTNHRNISPDDDPTSPSRWPHHHWPPPLITNPNAVINHTHNNSHGSNDGSPRAAGGAGGGGGGAGNGGAASVATALAQWARSPFGMGGMQPPPPSPKEMDAAQAAFAAQAGPAAELPSPDLEGGEHRRGGRGGRTVNWGDDVESGRGRVAGGGQTQGQQAQRQTQTQTGRGAWFNAARRVHVAGQEVELPTPDTPGRRERESRGSRK